MQAPEEHEPDQTNGPEGAAESPLEPFGEQATGAYTAQPVPGEPAQVGSPGFEGFPAAGPAIGPNDDDVARSPTKRVGLIVTAVIAIAALVALALVVPMALFG